MRRGERIIEKLLEFPQGLTAKQLAALLNDETQLISMQLGKMHSYQQIIRERVDASPRLEYLYKTKPPSPSLVPGQPSEVSTERTARRAIENVG